MQQTVPLFGRGYKDVGAQVNAQRRVNVYIKPAPEPEKGATFTLCTTPGLTRLAYVGTKPARGAIVIGGHVYAVIDSTLYRIAPGGSYASLGNIATNGTDYVSMAWNGNTQLMFVDGSAGYIYDLANATLSEITDADFPDNPTTVCYFTQRFIISVADSAKFYWSALLDGTSWDALDFATAESETDNLVAVASDHGALHLIGEFTTEFWAPTGDDSVFTRVGGSGIEWGCVSARTIAKFDTGLVWLARNTLGECRVIKLSGYNPVPLDDVNVTRAVNDQRQAQDDLSNMTGLSYTLDGQHFYQLNFVELSLLYDGFGWSKVTSSTTIEGSRHLANLRVQMSDEPYVFSYFDGVLYKIDKDALTDDGQTIVREVTTRHMFNSGNRVMVAALEIECETGSADATEPLMMLQYSRDGGMTWSNEIRRGMGAVGEYFKRLVWRRLGVARDFVFKLRVTDAVRFSIVAASATVASE